MYKINDYLPKQGDIIWFNSNPTSGREINKHRPALVLSGVEFNSTTGFIVVAPITSTKKEFLVRLPDKYITTGYVNYIHLKSIDFIEKDRQVRYKESTDLELVGRVLIKVNDIFNLSEIFDI